MASSKKLEDIFLSLFKGTVVVLMALALLAMVALLAGAAYQFTKQPVEPEPAKVAPQRDVTLDDLKKSLMKGKGAVPAPSTTPQSGTQVPNSLKYLEDVTRLYRCSVDFAKKVGAEIDETDNAVISQRVEGLRSQVERLADAEAQRGERWVKSAVTFTCGALADPEIIQWRKDGKIDGVFFAVLNYHLERWDQLQAERDRFNREEQERVARQKAEEEARVAQARATALVMLASAGGAFAVFMALALYLILAKIEVSLRLMNGNIGAVRTHITGEVAAQ